jgi:hypothetical protein
MLDNPPQTAWWALTGSNRRHLPCKRTDLGSADLMSRENEPATNALKARTWPDSRSTFGPPITPTALLRAIARVEPKEIIA